MSPARSEAPLAVVALAARCPRCGRGPLFDGYLRIAPACTNCGLSFAGHDTGDGPAFFIMLPLCLITAGLALVLEMSAQPPAWVHLILWPVFIVGTIGLLLRPVKALMVGLQYRYRDVENDDASGQH